MFNKEIFGLALTNQVADNLFHNITGYNPFGRDESFLATLRALMYKRVPKEESITLAYSNSSYGEVEIAGASRRDIMRAFLRRNSAIIRGDYGILHIHSFNGGEAANNACFNVLDAGAMADLFGAGVYEPLLDVNEWLKQNGRFSARVYISQERKSAVIFANNIDIKRWHLLQVLIPRYFPWYVKDNPLTDDEKALIKSLTKRYAPDYEDKIQSFSKKFDFRSEMIKTMLKGFETRFERDRLNEIRGRIADVNNSIDSLRARFANFYRELQDLNIQETGLIEKIRRGGGEESSEFMDYFLCNKSLNIVEVRGGRIKFIVTTNIANFDPDVFDCDIRNRNSYFYRHYQTGERYENKEMTDDRIERLMREIFEKERMKLRVCAIYYLNFSDGDYGAIRNYQYPADILSDHIPNQHIQVYACLGGNETYIYDAMRKRDYIAALEACVSSAKSMNLTEHNTGTFFMQAICANDVGKIIEMPDGSTKTPVEAVKWLEEQDAMVAKKEEE